MCFKGDINHLLLHFYKQGLIHCFAFIFGNSNIQLSRKPYPNSQ